MHFEFTSDQIIRRKWTFPLHEIYKFIINFWGEPCDSDQLKTNNWSGGKKSK